MEKVNTLKVGDFVVQITTNKGSNIKDHKLNNIDIYNTNGEHLYNISELLLKYQKVKPDFPNEELFSEIKLLENGNVKCFGFNLHLEIDLELKEIANIDVNW